MKTTLITGSNPQTFNTALNTALDKIGDNFVDIKYQMPNPVTFTALIIHK